MIKIVVVDDQTLIRSAVRDLLDQADDLTVVGEAADGAEALVVAAESHPDVVVMDIRMPVLDGLEATRQLLAHPHLPQIKILILTTFEEDENVFEALRLGASGFVGKGTEPDDLLRAVRTVAAGESLLSPRATRGLIDRYLKLSTLVAGSESSSTALAQLTERETEILIMVALGLSNDQIATRLVISPLTVKTHLKRTMMKLAAHDRAQLVIFAYESGLLKPGRR